MNTLVTPFDLTPFGGVLDEAAVDAAVAAVRLAADWHIAPQVTETITVPSWGGKDLHLRSRAVTAVTAVRNGSDVLASWTFRPGGVLHRAQGWPVGMLSVDLTHGYTSCPPDLLPVIARAAKASVGADPAVASSRIGDVQITYRNGVAVVARVDVQQHAAWAGVA